MSSSSQVSPAAPKRGRPKKNETEEERRTREYLSRQKRLAYMATFNARIRERAAGRRSAASTMAVACGSEHATSLAGDEQSDLAGIATASDSAPPVESDEASAAQSQQLAMDKWIVLTEAAEETQEAKRQANKDEDKHKASEAFKVRELTKGMLMRNQLLRQAQITGEEEEYNNEEEDFEDDDTVTQASDGEEKGGDEVLSTASRKRKDLSTAPGPQAASQSAVGNLCPAEPKKRITDRILTSMKASDREFIAALQAIEDRKMDRLERIFTANARATATAQALASPSASQQSPVDVSNAQLEQRMASIEDKLDLLIDLLKNGS
ncbi:hypothetical protein FN846DRAFT_948846 [Sphaerosporella brunnea]|uniref:Uncharacterized protein n=1 Tax=Sphaerosporella brunnea TaxID=1250544 RepID=A0A5J5EXL2_9PEZI|nr:hypothetical protein FN846DRAFT_948846 [Sphaerosporella brunnea]